MVSSTTGRAGAGAVGSGRTVELVAEGSGAGVPGSREGGTVWGARGVGLVRWLPLGRAGAVVAVTRVRRSTGPVDGMALSFSGWFAPDTSYGSSGDGEVEGWPVPLGPW
ncbi:MAG: hypothetical protein WA890_11065 [Micromonospora sp.]